ncbi:hypothetical protein LCGC14_1715330 [marine sediment metagenome]|uniref:Uncharacterized protein n=1 Tax=marine sediment metagenome TaxID=412755 RepID=A0A0F9HEG2_9ZZZZ
MTHTPGPWKAEGEFVREAGGRAISYCQSASGKREIEEVRANARLEAAAPDMEIEIAKLRQDNADLLKTLEMAREFLGRNETAMHRDFPDDLSYGQPELEAITRIIAKAKP